MGFFKRQRLTISKAAFLCVFGGALASGLVLTDARADEVRSSRQVDRSTLYRGSDVDESVQRTGTAGTEPSGMTAPNTRRAAPYGKPRYRMGGTADSGSDNTVYRSGTDGDQPGMYRRSRGQTFLPWMHSWARDDGDLGTDGSVYRLGTMGTQGPFHESAW